MPFLALLLPVFFSAGKFRPYQLRVYILCIYYIWTLNSSIALYHQLIILAKFCLECSHSSSKGTHFQSPEAFSQGVQGNQLELKKMVLISSWHIYSWHLLPHRRNSGMWYATVFPQAKIWFVELNSFTSTFLLSAFLCFLSWTQNIANLF